MQTISGWLGFAAFLVSPFFVVEDEISSREIEFICTKSLIVPSLFSTQRAILKTSRHGDWFLLTRLISNMNPIVATFFVHELGEWKEYQAYQATFHDDVD